MQVAIRSSTLQHLGNRSCSGAALAQGNEKSPAVFSGAMGFTSLERGCRIIPSLHLYLPFLGVPEVQGFCSQARDTAVSSL